MFPNALISSVDDISDAVETTMPANAPAYDAGLWSKALTSINTDLRIGPVAFKEFSANEYMTIGNLPSGRFGASVRRRAGLPPAASEPQGPYSWETRSSWNFLETCKQHTVNGTWFRGAAYNPNWIRTSREGSAETSSFYNGECSSPMTKSLLNNIDVGHPFGATAALSALLDSSMWDKYQRVAEGEFESDSAEAPRAGTGAWDLLRLLYDLSDWHLWTNLHKMAKRDFTDPSMLGFLAQNDLVKGVTPRYAQRVYILGQLGAFAYAPALAMWRLLDTVYDIPEFVEAERRAQNPAEFDQFRAYAMGLRSLPLPIPLARVVEYGLPSGADHPLSLLHDTVLALAINATSRGSSSTQAMRKFTALGVQTYPSVGSPKLFHSFFDKYNMSAYHTLTRRLHELLTPSNSGLMDVGQIYAKGASTFGFVQPSTARARYQDPIIVDGISADGAATSFGDLLVSDPIPSEFASGELVLATKRAVPGSNAKVIIPDEVTYYAPILRDSESFSRVIGKYGADIFDFRGQPATSDDVNYRSIIDVRRPMREFRNDRAGWESETGMTEDEFQAWVTYLRALTEPVINATLDTFMTGTAFRSEVMMVMKGAEAKELNTSVRFRVLGSDNMKVLPFTDDGSLLLTTEHDLRTGHKFSLLNGRLFSEYDPNGTVYARTSEIVMPKRLITSM